MGLIWWRFYNFKYYISILNGTDCFKNDENININNEIDNTKGKLIVPECKFTLNANLNLKVKSGKLVKEETIKCLNKIVKTPTNIKEKKKFFWFYIIKRIC